MSRWDRWGWYQPTPKRPPPAHGIKVKKTGSTWWGQRWIEALETMSRGYSNRLARGHTYARAGRVHDLVVEAGQVTAKVTGSRATPYTVTIMLAKLSASTWKKAIEAMAGKAQFAAELLAGQMPKEIDGAFHDAGASLFPATEAALRTSCSCPDWANPCKHVAATHYVLGETLDRDPFLLFELRGRTKEQVLDALRAARSGDADPQGRRATRAKGAGGTVADVEIAKVTLGTIEAADYDRPRAALPALHLAFEEPAVHGAVLRQLGAPASWSGDASPADLLAPIVRAASERARRLALAEPEADSEEPVAAVQATAGGAKRKPGTTSAQRATSRARKAVARAAKPRSR